MAGIATVATLPKGPMRPPVRVPLPHRTTPLHTPLPMPPHAAAARPSPAAGHLPRPTNRPRAPSFELEVTSPTPFFEAQNKKQSKKQHNISPSALAEYEEEERQFELIGFGWVAANLSVVTLEAIVVLAKVYQGADVACAVATPEWARVCNILQYAACRMDGVQVFHLRGPNSPHLA